MIRLSKTYFLKLNRQTILKIWSLDNSGKSPVEAGFFYLKHKQNQKPNSEPDFLAEIIFKGEYLIHVIVVAQVAKERVSQEKSVHDHDEQDENEQKMGQ